MFCLFYCVLDISTSKAGYFSRYPSDPEMTAVDFILTYQQIFKAPQITHCLRDDPNTEVSFYRFGVHILQWNIQVTIQLQKVSQERFYEGGGGGGGGREGVSQEK